MEAAPKSVFSVVGVCFAVAIGGLIFSEINLALASIKNVFHASITQLQWILNTYGIFVSSTLVLFGRVGDIVGRKRLFIVGLGILSIAMLGSGLAPNIYVLIACQALNGASSAIIMPVSQAMLTNMYPPQRRSKAIGLWAGAVGIALGLGPLYSGIIIGMLGWRWVFLFNVPMILLALYWVIRYADESRTDEEAPQLDYLGALLLMLSLGAFVIMIVEAENWPLNISVLLLIISAIGFSLLYWVESKIAKQPIIRKDLFRNRAFFLSSFCNCCLLFFIWAGFFLIPLFLQQRLTYSPVMSGLIMLLVTIPLTLFSFYSEGFYYRFGPRRLILVGFLCLMLSAFSQLFFTNSVSGMTIMIATISFGLAWGLIWNPSATRAISTLSQSQAGVASGTFVTFQEIGGSCGLAVSGAILHYYADFITGYQHAAMILLIVSLVGFMAAYLMHPEKQAAISDH